MIRFEGSISELRDFLNNTFTKWGQLQVRLKVEIELPAEPKMVKELEYPVKYPVFRTDQLINGSSLTTCGAYRVAHPFMPGSKIAAIKAVREVTNLGLKEAKDWVESVFP